MFAEFDDRPLPCQKNYRVMFRKRQGIEKGGVQLREE